MEKPDERGNIDLNQVFTGDDRDLNSLFPDPPMRRFLKEIKQQKREVRTFLEGLATGDEESE